MASNTLDAGFAGTRPPFRYAKGVTATLVAGRPTSLWALTGAPGPGGFDATLNGVVLSSSAAQVAGQLPHTDPASGESRLWRFSGVSSAQAGVLSLFDRLWHNGGFTITSITAQAITSPAWPSRCPTSAADETASVNGYGVQLAVEVSAAVGAGAPTITISYTNEAGVAGRTATNVLATVASPVAGTVHFMGLQAGDLGVRSVQSLTLSATWTSGTINLVAYRPITDLELAGVGVPNAVDALTSGRPREYNGVVPWLVFTPSTTSPTSLSGIYLETQG